MNTKELVTKLKARAEKDAVFNNVMLVFAARERARAQVTLQSLMQRMEKEGFKHTTGEYASVLIFMAELGLGRLQRVGGRVKALVEPPYTLQSIGQAVHGSGSITSFKRRRRYKPLPTTTPVSVAATAPKTPPVRPTSGPGTGALAAGAQVPSDLVYGAPGGVDRRKASGTVGLTMAVNGKTVVIPVPRDFTPDDLAYLVSKLQDRQAG